MNLSKIILIYMVFKATSAKKSSNNASKWSFLLKAQMKMILLMSSSSNLTQKLASCTVSFMPGTFHHLLEWPRSTTNIFQACMDTVQELCVTGKRSFLLAWAITSKSPDLRFSVQDAKKSIFQSSDQWILMEHFSVPHSHTSFWNTIHRPSSFHQRSTTTSQKYTDSR